MLSSTVAARGDAGKHRHPSAQGCAVPDHRPIPVTHFHPLPIVEQRHRGLEKHARADARIRQDIAIRFDCDKVTNRYLSVNDRVRANCVPIGA